jgi:hypothetical protein
VPPRSLVPSPGRGCSLVAGPGRGCSLVAGPGRSCSRVLSRKGNPRSCVCVRVLCARDAFAHSRSATARSSRAASRSRSAPRRETTGWRRRSRCSTGSPHALTLPRLAYASPPAGRAFRQTRPPSGASVLRKESNSGRFVRRLVADPLESDVLHPGRGSRDGRPFAQAGSRALRRLLRGLRSAVPCAAVGPAAARTVAGPPYVRLRGSAAARLRPRGTTQLRLGRERVRRGRPARGGSASHIDAYPPRAGGARAWVDVRAWREEIAPHRGRDLWVQLSRLTGRSSAGNEPRVTETRDDGAHDWGRVGGAKRVPTGFCGARRTARARRGRGRKKRRRVPFS